MKLIIPPFWVGLVILCFNIVNTTGTMTSVGKSIRQHLSNEKKAKGKGAQQGRVLLNEKTDALCNPTNSGGGEFKEKICPILLKLETVFLRKKHLLNLSDVGTLRAVLTGIGQESASFSPEGHKVPIEFDAYISNQEIPPNEIERYQANPLLDEKRRLLRGTDYLVTLLSSLNEIFGKIENPGQAHRALTGVIVLAMLSYPTLFTPAYTRDITFRSLPHPLNLKCFPELEKLVQTTKAGDANSFSSGTLMVIMFLSSLCEINNPARSALNSVAEKLIAAATAASSAQEKSNVEKTRQTISAIIAEANDGVEATIKRLNKILI